MIKALLDKIGGLLEKEFLFGSFLPALIFTSACAATVAGILGFEASLMWIGQRGPVDKVMYPVVAAVAIIVFAYVLRGIRPLTQRLWNGEDLPLVLRPIGNVLTAFARRAYLSERARQPDQWTTIAVWLQTEWLQRWDKGTNAASVQEIRTILDALSSLNREMTCHDVKKIVDREFLAKLDVYSGESLRAVYQKLERTLLDWQTLAKLDLGTIHWQLDQNYGSVRMRATRLGNLTMAYNAYPFTRYGMEPRLFWPHLQTQLSEGCREALGDAQTLLDFALNIATLGSLYCLLCVFVGPWLDWSSLWLLLAPVGALVAIAGYYIAIFTTTEGLGALVRASFDLYRLNLLAAMHRETPKTLEEECVMWRQISEHMLNGQSQNYELTPVAPEGDAA